MKSNPQKFSAEKSKTFISQSFFIFPAKFSPQKCANIKSVSRIDPISGYLTVLPSSLEQCQETFAAK